MANAIIERVGGVGVDCDDATATTANVLTPYTFGGSAADEVQTGTMPDRGTTNGSITTNGGTYTVPEGYHSGSGKVTYTLPSVAGGTTYTPTAAAQTISLSDKYLKANIAVAGSSNLVAKNIVSGKTIWGVAGSHQNYADISTVYNGSSFYGFLTGGVLTNVVQTTDPDYASAYRILFTEMNNITADTGSNNHISSGSLYSTVSHSISDSTWSDPSGGFVSLKTVNFSLFSTLRVVGYHNASFANYSENYNRMYVQPHIRAYPVTIENGVANNHGYTLEKTADAPQWDSGKIKNTKTSSDNISFDLSFDISGWTSTSAFLGIKIFDNTERTAAYYNWTSYAAGFYITAIYLT